MDSAPSFLTIVVDVDSLCSVFSARSAKIEKRIDVNQIISGLCIFCNSYVMMGRQNRLLVLSVRSTGVDSIYPSTEVLSRSIESNNFIPYLPNLNEVMIKELSESISKQQMELNSAGPNKSRGLLVRALSTAITVTNRQLQTNKLQSRILVIQFDRDKPQNYNAIMNTIFW